MKATHTPGPWKYESWRYPLANPPRNEFVIVGQNFRLAVLDHADGADNPYTIPTPEAEANARLMASAPDLLRALEMYVAAFPRCHLLNEPEKVAAYDAAKYYIQQAKGPANET